MPASFKDAFCARFDCEPEDFQTKAISQCLYPHAQAVWPMLDLVGARTTHAATVLIEMAAETRSEDDLRSVIEQYLEEVYPKMGRVAKKTGLRVSTKRLLKLYQAVSGEGKNVARV
jgi:hypothetical protein